MLDWSFFMWLLFVQGTYTLTRSRCGQWGFGCGSTELGGALAVRQASKDRGSGVITGCLWWENTALYGCMYMYILCVNMLCFCSTVECRTRFLCASFRADEPVELTVSLLSTAPLPLNLTKLCVLFFQEVRTSWTKSQCPPKMFL